MTRISFMNTTIDNLSMDEALDVIEKLVKEDANAYVVTPNVDHIVRLEYDREFRAAYKNANLILADGMPLIWISKIYGTPIKQKISGADLLPKLCERAAKKNYTMFFLGAPEGVGERARQVLEHQYQGLKVVGTYSPPYMFEKNAEEVRKIVKMLREIKPDILILGLSGPRQENFIYRYRNIMGVPVSLGLGASLDFAAGSSKRAPKWMQDHGLEWLYRMIHDKRLVRRYLVNDTTIVFLFFKYLFRTKKA